MKTIEISEATFEALGKKARGFDETPDSVIQRLLAGEVGSPPSVPQQKPGASELQTLLESIAFRHLNGRDRYFRILRFLYDQKPDGFENLLGLKFGKRIQIARDAETIEKSGKSTFPEPIPGTPYWALTNLSNRSKRDVLFSAMQLLKYPEAEIRTAVNSIPDSSPGRSSAAILRGI